MSTGTYLSIDTFLSRCICIGAFLFLFCPSPIRAQQSHRGSSDDQISAAVQQAVGISHPTSTNQAMEVRRRQDLEDDLSRIAGKQLRDVYFYDVESTAPSAVNDDSVWAVVTGSPREAYALFDFEATQEFNESTQEFNRLISKLTLSIPNDRATSLAEFFLGCCVRGEVNQVVLDEEGLRHAVERYYLTSYGDVWRALEANSQWWEESETDPLDLAPSVAVDGDGYRIALKRVRLVVGTHPQLQQWNLAISRSGAVRVLSVEALFPKQTRWLSYDFRSTFTPGAVTGAAEIHQSIEKAPADTGSEGVVIARRPRYPIEP